MKLHDFEQRRREVEATPLPSSIPELLRRARRLYGDDEAICFFEDGDVLTFRQLSDRVRQTAQGLARIGVQHGSRVAVMLSNRVEFPVLWLAIAELGAVICPLITSHTAREVAFVLEDAKITHLVIEHAFRAVLADLGEETTRHLARVVAVGDRPSEGAILDLDELVEGCDTAFEPERPPGLDDVMSIQYTSGTTGLPKGVVLTQRYWLLAGVSTALMWREAGIRSALSDHPFFYMDSQWMLVLGLYFGGRTDFCRKMSVRKFPAWMRERRRDVAYLPDPLLGEPEGPDDAGLQAKVYLAYAYTRDMVIEAERRFRTPVRECYGMTEIGLGLMVPLRIDDEAILGTCGFPGPWRECRVVDENLADVPDGQSGELLVRGPGICQGYLNRPDTNARTFVDGWFRTGDLFVRDERGFYRMVGRIKDMIKRSGENISAVEVEQVLCQIPGVLEAAVVAVPDKRRDEEVKAYLLLREGVDKAQVTPEAVAEHCARNLARFKVPRYIAYVDDFPYTASLKIAKHELLKMQSDLRSNAYDRIDQVWR